MTFEIADRINSHMRCRGALSDSKTLTAPIAYYLRGNWGTKRELASVSSVGLHGVELIEEKPFAWTDGNASLLFVFSRPRRIRWGSIVVNTGPISNLLTISVGEGTPAQVLLKGRRVIRFRAKGYSEINSLKIGIRSQTFLPLLHEKTSSDTRRLGVMLGEVQFAKYWWRLPPKGIRLPFRLSHLFSSISFWRRRLRSTG